MLSVFHRKKHVVAASAILLIIPLAATANDQDLLAALQAAGSDLGRTLAQRSGTHDVQVAAVADSNTLEGTAITVRSVVEQPSLATKDIASCNVLLRPDGVGAIIKLDEGNGFQPKEPVADEHQRFLRELLLDLSEGTLQRITVKLQRRIAPQFQHRGIQSLRYDSAVEQIVTATRAQLKGWRYWPQHEQKGALVWCTHSFERQATQRSKRMVGFTIPTLSDVGTRLSRTLNYLAHFRLRVKN